MYCETFVDGLEGKDMHAEAHAALLAWQTLAKNGSLPACETFWELRPHADGDSWMLLKPLSCNEFLYEHYGDAIATAFGVSLAGRTTASLEVSVRGILSRLYQSVVQSRKPTFAVHRASYATNVQLWERLVLPLAWNDGTLRLAVIARPRQTVQDLLKGVMQATPVGIVVCQAVRGSDGSVIDATVSAVNPKAEGILGRSAGDLINKRILEIYPRLVEKGVWERYKDVMDNRRSHEFEYFDSYSYRWFDVKAEAVGDGFLVVLTDITAIRNAHYELEQAKRRAEDAQAELALEIQAREILESELRRISSVDELTCVLNRRGFDRAASGAAKAAQQNDDNLAVIAIDIDHFKYVNDHYGHSGGDWVLRTVADTLAALAGARGPVGRVGGEEFMVLLPGYSARRAAELAEELRKAIAETPVTHDGLTFSVTASFGVQDLRSASTVEAMLIQADRALYGSKENGRDRVSIYGQNMIERDLIVWESSSQNAMDITYID